MCDFFFHYVCDLYRMLLVMYCVLTFCHTSNSCECMGVNGEALQLHTVYEKPYLLSHDNYKIIITIVPSCTGKKYHLFLAVDIVTHAACL